MGYYSLIHHLIKVLTHTLLATCLVFAANANADNPKVKMNTNKGTVIIELFPDKAPQTVKNFLHYVNEGKYNNTIFHRVIKGFVNQGGGYNHDHKAIETFSPIKNEADNGLKNKRGSIAMARTDEPHSALNQFFINTADNTILDHTDKTSSGWGYCVFGEVIEGMEVMDRIAKVKTQAHGPFDANAPLFPITIRSISLIETDYND